MAASGSVIIRTESVDYNGGGPYTRGACKLYNEVGWAVDDNSNISFWSISSEDNVHGSWYICRSSTSAGYNVELVPQVSYNGGASWVNLDVKQRWVSEECGVGQANTITMSKTLIGQLGSYHLEGDCSLRFLYYMTVAPAPDARYKNAFPNSSYSEAVQVPVYVEVSWEAGLHFNGNGGTGVPADIVYTVRGQDSTTITIPGNIPTWGWHRFEGYSANRDSRTAQFQPGDTVTLTKASPSLTLYAIWTEYYRPGAQLKSGAWKSHQRNGGACNVREEGSWVEKRTIDGGTETNDPPQFRTGGAWKNMNRIGDES